MKLELFLVFGAMIVLSQGLNILPQLEDLEDDVQGLQSVAQALLPEFAAEDYLLKESELAEPGSYAPRHKDSEKNPTQPGLLPPPVNPTSPPSKCCWIWSCEPPMNTPSHPVGLISCFST